MCDLQGGIYEISFRIEKNERMRARAVELHE